MDCSQPIYCPWHDMHLRLFLISPTINRFFNPHTHTHTHTWNNNKKLEIDFFCPCCCCFSAIRQKKSNRVIISTWIQFSMFFWVNRRGKSPRMKIDMAFNWKAINCKLLDDMQWMSCMLIFFYTLYVVYVRYLVDVRGAGRLMGFFVDFLRVFCL